MDEILTLVEASSLLKVSGSWLRPSDCPRIRFSSKLVRYSRVQIEAWFTARLTHSVRDRPSDNEGA